MLTWACQLPFDDESADVAEIVTAYGAWPADNPIPKRFIPSDQGIIPPSVLTVCRAWPMPHEFTARGRSYPQESAPDKVGQALAT
jgi:haloalkane dehalogenase